MKNSIFLLISLFVCTHLSAQETQNAFSALGVFLGSEGGVFSGDYLFKILSFIAVVTLLPATLVLMTSFTRIMIVLSFLRQGLGLNGVPSNQVLLGLSFVLSLVVMSPVLSSIYEEAYVPYTNEKIDRNKALSVSGAHLLGFMKKNTSQKEIDLITKITKGKEDSFLTLLPAFALSEVKMAFLMGFVIFLPFLLIDIIVSVTLISTGLISLSPVTLAIPLKVLLFLVIDGWALLMGSFAKGFYF